MRVAVVATAVILSVVGISIAEEAEASIRRTTKIPAQALGAALQALAKERDFQVIYRSEVVDDLRTPGAVGELTVTEALTQLLSGTGLAYRYLDEKTITIVQAGTAGGEKDSQGNERNPSREGRGETSKGAILPGEEKKSLWHKLRLAQADPSSRSEEDKEGSSRENEKNRTELEGTVPNEEIVVTATRRAQSVRDVPSSLAVVSGQALQDQAATGLDDYLRQVPGVQFNDIGAGQASNITIRGVSTSVGVGITQQTVGLYVDEIPFSDVFSFLSTPDLTPFDLDRVEVLRGPQGALYGSGSMGGAIRYVTAKPEVGHLGAKFNGAISAAEDGGINTISQVMLNVPIGDTLAVRGVVSNMTDDGYVDSPALNLKDTDSLEQVHARIAVRWKPSDRADIQASHIYQRAKNGDYSTISDPTGQNLVDNLGTSGIQLTYRLANLTANYDLGFADFLGSLSYAGKRRNTGINIRQTTTEIQNGLAGYEGFLTAVFTPQGAYTPGDLFARGVAFTTFALPESDGYFAEGRITSKSDGRFRWLAGFLDTDIKNFNPIFQDAPGIFDALTSYVLPSGTNAAQFLGITSDRTLDFFQRSHAREKAAYFDLEFDITDQLEITAGGRYFDFDVSTQMSLNGGLLADLDNAESAFQPRITASYKPTPDTLFYAVFSKGYRVGGVNDTIAFTLLPGQDIEDSPAPLNYDTDSLYNYEVGVKSQLFGGKLLFDLAAYYIDWSGIQLSAFFPAPLSPTGGVAAITNVGSANIYGVEAQFTLKPTRWAELVSSISYNDAELAEPSPLVQNFVTGQLVSAPAGTQLPGSRKWQTSNTLVLNGDIQQIPLTFTATHQYASGTLLDIVYLERLPSYHLVNVNLDARLRDNLRIGVFARNLFDERKVVQTSPFPPRNWVVTRPRTIGISLSAEF